MPAAVAMSAATTFERMPPEPWVEVDCVIASSSSAAKSSTRSTSDALGSRRGSAVCSPSELVRITRRPAPTRIATWAARKSLSPKVISSVAVVSFSLTTGTAPHSSSLPSVWRALR